MDMNRYQGLGLIELMISLCLSALLLAFLMGHFVFSKRQYHRAGEILANQLELALVEQLIRDSIRSAGFTPCSGLDHLIIRDRRDNPKPISAVKLIPRLPQSLVLSSMDEHYVIGLRQQGPRELLLKGSCSLDKGRAIMISDCFHAEIHRLQSCQKKGQNAVVHLVKPLEFSYPASFYVGAWIEEEFYTAKNQQSEPALFYASPEREELTTNIQGLRGEFKKPWLLLYLFLKDGQKICLETRMRNP